MYKPIILPSLCVVLLSACSSSQESGSTGGSASAGASGVAAAADTGAGNSADTSMATGSGTTTSGLQGTTTQVPTEATNQDDAMATATGTAAGGAATSGTQAGAGAPSANDASNTGTLAAAGGDSGAAGAGSDNMAQNAVGGAGSGGEGGALAGAGGAGGALEQAGGAATAMAGSGAGGEGGAGDVANGDDGSMSFFVTSRGMDDGGNLGGLEGADAFCQQLAEAAGFGDKTWRAYLSTDTVNARERIGSGPWRNQAGVIIANDLDELHDQAEGGALDATWPPADLSIALDETGAQVDNSVHDILTGSLEDGTVAASTCQNWTSNSSDEVGQVGHSNRDGGGRPPSFSTTHEVGCGPAAGQNRVSGTVTSGGGRGSLYCFAL